MKMTILLIVLLLAMRAFGDEKPKVIYAGEGRYTCSGSSVACAQIDANNRALERDRQARQDQRDRDQRSQTR